MWREKQQVWWGGKEDRNNLEGKHEAMLAGKGRRQRWGSRTSYQSRSPGTLLLLCTSPPGIPQEIWPPLSPFTIMPYLSDITSALNKRSRSDSSHAPHVKSTNAHYPAAENTSSAALLLAPAAPGNLRHEGRPKKPRGEGGQLFAALFKSSSPASTSMICILLGTGSWCKDGPCFTPQTPFWLLPVPCGGGSCHFTT